MLNKHSVKLTINLTAENFFFQEKDVHGIRFKIEDGRIHLRPSGINLGPDTVVLTGRTRGGKEAIIKHEEFPDLVEILSQQVTQNRPYFIMFRPKRYTGWINIEHHDEDIAPNRFAPHMRVWFPHPPKKMVIEKVDAIHLAIDRFGDVTLSALLNAYVKQQTALGTVQIVGAD